MAPPTLRAPAAPFTTSPDPPLVVGPQLEPPLPPRPGLPYPSCTNTAAVPFSPGRALRSGQRLQSGSLVPPRPPAPPVGSSADGPPGQPLTPRGPALPRCVLLHAVAPSLPAPPILPSIAVVRDTFGADCPP